MSDYWRVQDIDREIDSITRQIIFAETTFVRLPCENVIKFKERKLNTLNNLYKERIRALKVSMEIEAKHKKILKKVWGE